MDTIQLKQQLDELWPDAQIIAEVRNALLDIVSDDCYVIYYDQEDIAAEQIVVHIPVSAPMTVICKRFSNMLTAASRFPHSADIAIGEIQVLPSRGVAAQYGFVQARYDYDRKFFLDDFVFGPLFPASRLYSNETVY